MAREEEHGPKTEAKTTKRDSIVQGEKLQICTVKRQCDGIRLTKKDDGRLGCRAENVDNAGEMGLMLGQDRMQT